jgi:hypothetical protein
MTSFLLFGSRMAEAFMGYNMTYLANVASGTSNNNISSPETNLDRTSAQYHVQ